VVILAISIAYAVVTFPYGDVTTAVSSPSVVNISRVAIDVAESVIPFAPKARLAVAGIQIVSVMLQHPSHNPIADAQLHLSRGGRRR
jgi:hypothetical protein